MKYKYFIVLTTLAMATTSCSDFLDKNPLDQTTVETYYKNEDQVKSALTALYSRMGFGWAGGLDVNDEVSVYTGLVGLDCCTDNGQMGWGANVTQGGTMVPSNGSIATYYKDQYVAIAKCNDFIASMESDKVNYLSDNVRKRYIAEAKFVRAWSYFNLTYLWGDVALILEPATADTKIGQSPQSEVLAAIINDLDYSIENLPNEAYTNGRFVKGAAYAMKMRTALYKKDYQGVVDCWTKYFGTSENKFSISNSYEDVFKGDKQRGNSEIIYSYYAADYTGTTLGWNAINDVILVTCSWGDMIGLQNCVDEYEFKDGTAFSKTNPLYDAADPFNNRDPRLNMIFLDPVLRNTEGSKYNIPSVTTKTTAIKKYLLDSDLPIAHGYLPKRDAVLLRYSDVVLMYAEALNELGGKTADVIKTVQLVRGRKGVEMPALSASLSQDQLRTAIKHERRVEFAFEGTRYLDLLRWKDMKAAMVKAAVDDPKRSFEEYQYWWPIPAQAILQNPALKKTAGYTY